MAQNIFCGEGAMQQFLDPREHVTPLVELPIYLNPYYQDWVKIFLKLQTFLPLGNIKSISARGMLQNGLQSAGESPLHTLVENSSWNTAFSLAVLGRSMWIPHMRAWISNETTPWKLKLLQIFGVHPVVNQEQICPNPNDKKSWIYKAKKEWEQEWWFNPDQYHNLANPQIHYDLTGKQIWNQVRDLDSEYHFQIFCAGLGTTGTFIGISKYLKDQKSDFFALWVVRKPNNPISGPRTRKLLQQIGFDWESMVDGMQEVSSKQAYETSLNLIRSGLVVWPSSGMAVAGLFNHLQEMKDTWELQKKVEKDWILSAIVVCPDGPYPYFDEYFKYCEASLFPSIENQYLLLEKRHINSDDIDENLFWIDALFAYEELYTLESRNNVLTSQFNPNLVLNSELVLVDLRSEAEFDHVHLVWATHMDFDELQPNAFDNYFWKKIVLLCQYGKKSSYLAQKLNKDWFQVSSILWWLVSWSDLWLPRIVAEECKL